MGSYAHIVTTPTADTPGTLLMLCFEHKRYLLGNLGEGTQRACLHVNARWVKMYECFVTGRAEWSNIGGLIGMTLSLADSLTTSRESQTAIAKAKAIGKGKRMGVIGDTAKMEELFKEAYADLRDSQLSVFGPPNLNYMLATSRRFVFRRGMPINVLEIRDQKKSASEEDKWAPYWSDDNVDVWAMSISPTAQSDDRNAPAKSRPISPRKRSIDEVDEEDQRFGSDQHKSFANAIISDDLSPDERHQLTLKAVVGDMFNSSWRLDTLHETPLASVIMPATIFTRNPETRKIERYRGPVPGGRKPLPDPDVKVLVRRPWPGALIESLPPAQPAKEAISYIFRSHPRRGKFFPDKAIALKVPKGRKWAQLTKGESVLNEDGETVHTDQVLGDARAGIGLAVIDLPDPSYVSNMIARPEWREPKVMTGVGTVFWICGRGTALDARFQEFVRGMGHLKHIISSPEHCPNDLAMQTAAAATTRLHQVDAKRYKIPVHSTAADNIASGFGHGVSVAERGGTVPLEGRPDKSSFKSKPLDVEATIAEMSQDVVLESKKALQQIEAERPAIEEWASTLPCKDAEIITLGTGSALPSKHRNVAGTLLRVPGWGSLLFDCGEGTLGQLKRVFADQELKEVLRGLKAIVISHMHADHHLGTVSVIKAWYEEVHGAQPAPSPSADASVESLFEGQARLAVISEVAMQSWLAEYAAIEDYGWSRLAPLILSEGMPRRDILSKLTWYIPPTELSALHADERIARRERLTVPCSLLGLEDIQAVAVHHCLHARAVSITWPSGFKASYSGDCRPCKAFAEIGKGSTVCIHESTFDDSLQGDAQAKRHSTTSEALGVAQAMGARACVLTHFSQRYQKLPFVVPAGVDEDDDDGGHARLIDEDLRTAAEPADDQGDEEHDASGEPIDGLVEGDDEDVVATFPDQPAADGREYKPVSREAPAGGPSPPPEAVRVKLRSDMKVCVAFDYMRVKVGEIPEMQHFTPALLKLFAQEEGEERDDDASVASTASAVGKSAGGGSKRKRKDGLSDRAK